MRKPILFFSVVLIVAAAVVYFIWWQEQASIAELVERFGSVSVKDDYIIARHNFETARLVSIFLAGLGVISAGIAYTPWMWETRGDRG